MNDNGFAFNVERAQVKPLDAEALARRVAERAARVALAHAESFTSANGWSETFPGAAGYYYFADADEDGVVIVEAIASGCAVEVYYTGSAIAFAPESMDGKWKPVPAPVECGG